MVGLVYASACNEAWWQILVLDEHKLLASAGPQCDRTLFTEYVHRNMVLDKYRTGLTLSTKAAAHFVRGELAEAIRRAPYNVNILLGGVDKPAAGSEGAAEPSLFWIDYLGTLSQVNYGAQGYAAYFVSGLLDRSWRPKLSEADALDIIAKCAGEVRARFMLNQPHFICKKVSADGISEVVIPDIKLPDVSRVPRPVGAAAAAAAASSSSSEAPAVAVA